VLLPFKPTTHIFKIGRALTNTEIASLYALADKHRVGICLWQNTHSPSHAASTWGASGKMRRVIAFLWQLRERQLLG
jgi:hypothetical protein